MKSVFYYDTAIGRIGLAEKNGALSNLFFPRETALAGAVEQETPLLLRAADRLRRYLAGTDRDFNDIPLAPKGTPFQLAVWKALQAIPYGETRSYKDIAAASGSPKGFRAVGMANNKNPIAILIPCHRVIGADGSLTGYAGGLDVKRFLLELERGVRS